MTNMKTIVLVPYPAQGHVTPILKLAALLSNLSFRPIVVLPEFIHRRISPRIRHDALCISIPDGLPDDGPQDFFAIERAMEENMSPALESILQEMIRGGGVACLVADLLASWSIEVAQRCGVAVAGFWPAMHATYRLIAGIPELVRTQIISENGCPRSLDTPITMSSIDPILLTSDLPWLIGSTSSRISRFRFWARILQRVETIPYILANTFPSECQCNKTQQVLEIGPMIMQDAISINNATFWEEDTSYMDWLNKYDSKSVLYISFGSWVSPFSENKTKTLALTLEALETPFLWVLGQAWRQGLPTGYANRVLAFGRIVSWVPQMEVLRHPAVGCYLTHCGWNSTMEAIMHKKPMLCYPIAGDQFLNCRYIVNVWKIGMKLEEFTLEEVEDGIKSTVANAEMSQRIERLNEKVYGKEGSSKATSNLSTFIRDFNT